MKDIFKNITKICANCQKSFVIMAAEQEMALSKGGKISRSHMGLAGFFGNYDLAKQRKEEEKRRRELTEADIVKA